MAETTALAVANFILERAARDRIPIRHLKLQKIVYFCYAWYAGNTGQELFEEDIEAWRLGPVVREVYEEFSDCGSAPIHRRAIAYDVASGGPVEPRVPPQLEAELDSVWEAYKHKSDAWLVEATHQKGEPWYTLIEALGNNRKHRIPPDLIRNVYRDKVAAIGAQG